jgi:hypothetical protein
VAAVSNDDRAEAWRQVHGVLATITAAPSMRDALRALADGVVAAVGFGVACVNVVDEDGRLRAVAVAGSEDARHALMGRRYERAQFEAEFARADAWGRLLFVPHDRVHDREDLGWVPASAPSDDIESWTLSTRCSHRCTPRRASSSACCRWTCRGAAGDRGRCSAICSSWSPRTGAHARATALTEQLQLEQDRLRASDEAFRLAFHGAAVGMSILSLSGHDIGRFRAGQRGDVPDRRPLRRGARGPAAEPDHPSRRPGPGPAGG